MDELKNRKPLSHPPTEKFTMKREEYKQMEDLRLVKHFASWLSKVGEKPVSEENFEQDLMDGVALCRLMKKINGSNMGTFHEPSGGMDVFKAKENMVFFQNSAKALKLPISFGTEDLEKKNIGRVISTLIFVAHVAHSQGVTIKDMDKEILDKVVEMDQVMDEKVNASTPTEASEQQLNWWQALLVKFGLGDWIDSLNVETLKQYLATVRHNMEEKLPESIKAKLHVGEAPKPIEAPAAGTSE